MEGDELVEQGVSEENEREGKLVEQVLLSFFPCRMVFEEVVQVA